MKKIIILSLITALMPSLSIRCMENMEVDEFTENNQSLFLRPLMTQTSDQTDFKLSEISEANLALTQTRLSDLINDMYIETCVENSAEQKTKQYFIKFGEYHAQGFRDDMEDASIIRVPFLNNPNSGLFAIFDGHGGASVANYAAENIVKHLEKNNGTPEERLKNGLISLNKELSKQCFSDETGSCAIIALILNGKITIANLGDSRAILVRQNKAINLSIDHNGENPIEIERVKNKTGEKPQGKRFAGLAVSRALGDFHYDHICEIPEVQEIEINPDTDFLILYCDGLVERMNDLDIANVVTELLKENSNKPDTEMLAAKELVEIAFTGCKNKSEREMTLAIIDIWFKTLYMKSKYRISAFNEICSYNRKCDQRLSRHKPSGDNLSVIIVTFHSSK